MIAQNKKVVYDSRVYQHLHDSDCSLYAQSPSYIYKLLKQEIE